VDWDLGKDLGGGGVHPAVEEGVAREDNLLVAVLHEPADAVLGVAGCVKCLDGDAADLEGLAMSGCPGYLLAVLAADDL